MDIISNNNINNIVDTYKDTSVLEKKALRLSEADDKKLMDVCKEFESVFINMLLKEMKKTVPDSEFIEKSQGTLIFEDMHLEELSKEIAQGQGIGLAKMMYDQFKNGGIRL